MVAPGIYILLRLGMQILFQAPRHDAEHLMVIVLALACAALGALDAAPKAWAIWYSSLLNFFCLWRCAQVVSKPAARELGAEGASVVVGALRAFAAVFAVRLVMGLLSPDEVAVPLGTATASNVLVLAFFLTLGVILHLMLGIAVGLRLIARLETLTRHDPLTGLVNRRGLRAQWPQRWPLSLVVVDVDHFKRINDTHGHAAGDGALQHLARVLLRSGRSGDVVARVGGEEFVFVLPGSTVQEALIAAERVRKSVEEQTLRWGDLSLQFTISLGVAEQTHGESIDALMARADQALYRAKRNGRNQVVLAEAAAGGVEPEGASA